MAAEFWRGRRVLLTGHTGFKGSWLALWLRHKGAVVHGYATAPPTEPALFNEARVADGLASDVRADIRDAPATRSAVQAASPEVVFHLAAQSLVRLSYAQPIETYAVNVMGTANLLEALRQSPSVRAVVNVTSDKCYENLSQERAFREGDPLGGHDPYSSSKACVEILTAAYRGSFLAEADVAVASARAGNVIGGGDWAADRLIPDCFRALDADRTVEIRSPDSTRPWQHVLEPLAGYLLLAERLFDGGDAFAQAWNFGPDDEDAWSVGRVVEGLRARLPRLRCEFDAPAGPHEAPRLGLDSSKARSLLQWLPRWNVAEAIDRTVAWHEAWRQGADVRALCMAQIRDYEQAATRA